jgi:mannose-1-phosphate guanylyltransferase
MNTNNYVVIMAGGIGSRFWPMSRTNFPKQFIDILGTGRTLLQMTYDRFLKICPPENILIVTHESYQSLVKQQLPSIIDDNIICEPFRKNTAPCVAYANYKILAKNPDANIVVAPSDHLIKKEDTFIRAINNCLIKTANSDALLTLGLKPTRPDTGYGYIQFTESDVKEKDKRIGKVKTFTEKPELELAKSFIESGDFLWNSGIFIWSLKGIMKAFEQYDPEMNSIFKDGIDKYNTPNEKAFIQQAYSLCQNISIDKAIMEKSRNTYVRESMIGWSDLGTYGSLYTHLKKDEQGNAKVGKNIMLYNAQKNIINVPNDKLVVIDGLEGYIVVESNGALLICKKDNEQKIRDFVADVKLRADGNKYI